jgi:hypothetical protein
LYRSQPLPLLPPHFELAGFGIEISFIKGLGENPESAQRA